MQERMRWAVRWSAWLCLSLMFWTATAESTHNHPTRTSEASCSICVAAHSTSPTADSNSARPVFSQIGLAAEEDVLAYIRLNARDLGIRGPPVS